MAFGKSILKHGIVGGATGRGGHLISVNSDSVVHGHGGLAEAQTIGCFEGANCHTTPTWIGWCNFIAEQVGLTCPLVHFSEEDTSGACAVTATYRTLFRAAQALAANRNFGDASCHSISRMGTAAVPSFGPAGAVAGLGGS